MTPTQIEDQARAQYNAVNDTFFTQTEILNWIYQACLEFARETLGIEDTFTSSTLASQRQYQWPSNALAIKRIEYDGAKLQLETFREDDAITLNNTTSAYNGTPQFYAQWDRIFYLRPIPDQVKTLTVYAYIEPQPVTATSTIEVDTQWHMDLVDYVTHRMAAKDQNYNGSMFYLTKWNMTVSKAKQWYKKRRRGDAFNVVQNEDALNVTIQGPV